MLTLSAGKLVEVVRGELLYGADAVVVNGLAIDSREVHPGAAFVVFRGERVDGASFVTEALQAGARAILLDHGEEQALSAVEAAGREDVAIVRVADPRTALQALARHHRLRLQCPVIGLTGSTGKTSTKDLLKSVLATSMKVVATLENQNNELGVPLTIVRAGADTDALVVEMATRGSGQIAELCAVALPTIGMVTNVGQAHIEVLGSQEAIVDAKSELVMCVPEGGHVFLNGDDEWTGQLAEHAAATVIRYGEGESNDVRFSDVTADDRGRPSFMLHAGGQEAAVSLPLPGRHNAYNACAAAAVGLHMGLTFDDIVEGLASAEMTAMRMETFTTAAGVTVINDAYNANPTSMRAALRTLHDFRTEGRRIAILGDMAELGSLAELAHFNLGESAADLSPDLLVVVGKRASRIADGALAKGLPEERVLRFSSADEVARELGAVARPGDVVLVKASRVMRLEDVVEGMIRADV